MEKCVAILPTRRIVPVAGSARGVEKTGRFAQQTMRIIPPDVPRRAHASSMTAEFVSQHAIGRSDLAFSQVSVFVRQAMGHVMAVSMPSILHQFSTNFQMY